MSEYGEWIKVASEVFLLPSPTCRCPGKGLEYYYITPTLCARFADVTQQWAVLPDVGQGTIVTPGFRPARIFPTELVLILTYLWNTITV